MGKLTDKQISDLQACGYRLYESDEGQPVRLLYHPALYQVGINVDTGKVFYRSPNYFENSGSEGLLFDFAESFLSAAKILFRNRGDFPQLIPTLAELRDEEDQENTEDDTQPAILGNEETDTEETDESDEPAERVGGIRTAAIASVCRGAIRFNQMSAELVENLYAEGYKHIVLTKDSTATYVQFKDSPTKGSIFVRKETSKRTGKNSFVASRMDVAKKFFGECEKTEQYDAELLPDKKTLRLTKKC